MVSGMLPMTDALAQAPATRWDRLVAVLEDVAPERVIDASHIIERERKHHVRDVKLFYVLAMSYQEKHSTVLAEVLNLYVLMDTWIAWFLSTTANLQARRRQRSGDDGVAREESCVNAWHCPSAHRDAAGDTDGFRTRSVGRGGGGRWSAAARCRGEGASKCCADRTRDAVDLAACTPDDLLEFDTSVPWDGTLDFVRDGRLLCALVEEALRYTTTPPVVVARQTSPCIAAATAHLNPSPDESTAAACCTDDTTNTRVRGARRLQLESPSRSLMETRQEAVRVVHACAERLSRLCERHLGWCAPRHRGERFFEQDKSSSVMLPRNKDDMRLLHRLHWLALAVWKAVGNEELVPAPPRVSFVLHAAEFTPIPSSEVEKSEVGVQIATECSCLPFNSLLHVTLVKQNVMCVSHPVAHKAPRRYPCMMVRENAFVYDAAAGIFLPLWAVLCRLLREWEQIEWYFEMASEESRVQVNVLYGDCTLAAAATRRDADARSLTRSPGMSPWSLSSSFAMSRRAPNHAPHLHANGSGTFELTVQNDAFGAGDDVRRARCATAGEDALPRSQLRGVVHGNGVALSPRDAATTTTTTPPPPETDAVDDEGKREGDGWGNAECDAVDGVAPSMPTLAPHAEVDTGLTRRRVINFSATIIHESRERGIAVKEHRFRVNGRPIGKGAFGAVYRALDLETGIIVAVKQSRYSLDKSRVNFSWRELKTWSALPSHPNVITFHGASQEVETHQLLLVLEYASGGSITTLYHNYGPIPEHIFHRHAREVALGLQHLHDHNVVHGDVKPENVLCRSDGSVAIGDFGCSQLLMCPTFRNEPHTQRRLRRCGVHEQGGNPLSSDDDDDEAPVEEQAGGSSPRHLFGTVAYMAPEVIFHTAVLKSDVWAYACTLLQLWLGEQPWSGHAEGEIDLYDTVPLMYYIANSDVIPYTTEQIHGAPRWLQKIAYRAFERDVESRCNVAEILSILTEYNIL